MRKLHNIDFHIDLQPKIKEYLQELGVEFSQKGMHFGDCCLINIPDNLIEDIKQKFPEIQYRNAKTIIEKEDIQKFKEGDKLTIRHLETDFFPVRNAKGTVYQKTNNCLVVRAYKCRNKGWRIYEGDNCDIRKGW